MKAAFSSSVVNHKPLSPLSACGPWQLSSLPPPLCPLGYDYSLSGLLEGLHGGTANLGISHEKPLDSVEQ